MTFNDFDPDPNLLSWIGVLILVIILILMTLPQSKATEIWCVDLKNQNMYIQECVLPVCPCWPGYTQVNPDTKIELER